MDREEFAAKEGVCLCLFAGGGVRHARSPENSWEGLGPFHEKQGGGHAGPHPQPDTSQCTVCLRTDGIPMLYTHTDSKLIRDAIIAIILFFFFWPCYKACGFLGPQPGLLAVKAQSPATGPPGNSHCHFYRAKKNQSR